MLRSSSSFNTARSGRLRARHLRVHRGEEGRALMRRPVVRDQKNVRPQIGNGGHRSALAGLLDITGQHHPEATHLNPQDE